MKKQLKRLMRYKGYSIEISGIKYCWKEENIHTHTGELVTGTEFRTILMETQTIISDDKTQKIIRLQVK